MSYRTDLDDATLKHAVAEIMALFQSRIEGQPYALMGIRDVVNRAMESAVGNAMEEARSDGPHSPEPI